MSTMLFSRIETNIECSGNDYNNSEHANSQVNYTLQESDKIQPNPGRLCRIPIDKDFILKDTFIDSIITSDH